jgi:hypothetical protein
MISTKSPGRKAGWMLPLPEAAFLLDTPKPCLLVSAKSQDNKTIPRKCRMKNQAIVTKWLARWIPRCRFPRSCRADLTPRQHPLPHWAKNRAEDGLAVPQG